MLQTLLRYFALLCLSTLLLSGCTPISLELSNPAQLLQVPVSAQASTKESTTEATTACAVTPTVQDQPPDDPNADPFGFGNWHINADRTVWVDIPPSGIWHTGGEKVLWIRPAGVELVIRGQRLDAPAEPLTVEAPCCYPTSFAVNGLYFPAAGCWEVIATAGEHELNFVIEVEEGTQRAERAAPQRGVDPNSPVASSVLLQACTTYECELQLIDTKADATTDGFAPLELGRFGAFEASNDLTQLAVITYTNSDRMTDGQLAFVDLATWTSITTTLTFDGAYSAPLFTADNARLLVLTQTNGWPGNGIVHLIDVDNKRLLAEQPLDFYPLNFQFTPDGSGVMLFGTNNTDSATGTNTNSQVALLDATTLEIVWQEQVEGLLNGQVMAVGSTEWLDGFWWQPALAFAPDKAALYIVHADQEQLTTVDFDAQSVTTRAIIQPLSWIERLLMLTARTAYAKMANGVAKQAVLSPDGSQIYVVGTNYSVENKTEFIQTSLGLQVIDPATSEVSAQIDTDAQSITVDPLSGRLFLRGRATDDTNRLMPEWTEIRDAHTLELVELVENKAVTVGSRLDGTPILLATSTLKNGQTELEILDPETFEVIRSSSEPSGGYASWVVLR